MMEHLLSLPSSIATQEVINHIGSFFPYRESENKSMPAALTARMTLQQMSAESIEWATLLQLLGLLQIESSKQHQFRSRAAARSIAPPAELVTEVSVVTAVLIAGQPGHEQTYKRCKAHLQSRSRVGTVSSLCSDEHSSIVEP
jgi:hypothetical protein